MKDNPDEIVVDENGTWNYAGRIGEKYIRSDVSKEKIEVLNRIISARDATIRQLQGK